MVTVSLTAGCKAIVGFCRIKNVQTQPTSPAQELGPTKDSARKRNSQSMINQTKLLEIINGRRQGIGATMTRALLWALTPIYRLGVHRRNRRFETGKTVVTKVDVPVISVGNLTTGGTGKTPLVIWLCQQIRGVDRRVAIVSRGYGAAKNGDRTSKPNDEAMELGQRLPDVPHLQDPNRVDSARIAIDELETEVIVMDDGFQHRALGRDLDIIVVDATAPFGFGHLLPRGLLREPVENIARADFVVLSRCDQVSGEELSRTETNFRQYCPSLPVAKTKVQPATWMQYDGQQRELAEFASSLTKGTGSTNVFVCCAIGNPNSFLNTVSSTGVKVVGQNIYPDHHLYSRADMEDIAEAATEKGAAAIVCTHKDLVKMGVNQFRGVPIYALVAEIVFLQGETELRAAVESALG